MLDPASHLNLPLIIDSEATQLTRYVSMFDSTPEDLQPLRKAFIKTAMDEAGKIPMFIAASSEIAPLLSNSYSAAEIDPSPVKSLDVIEAADRIIACLVHVAGCADLRPAIARGRLEDVAQRLIAQELAALWHPRAKAVRQAALTRASRTAITDAP